MSHRRRRRYADDKLADLPPAERPTRGAQIQLDEHRRLLSYGLRAMAVALVFVVAAFTIGFVLLEDAADEATNASESATDTAAAVATVAADLRAGLLRSCRTTGNPLRVVLRGMLHDSIDQRSAIPRSFFPSIPRAKFRALIRAENAADRRRIRQTRKDEPCAVTWAASQ